MAPKMDRDTQGSGGNVAEFTPRERERPAGQEVAIRGTFDVDAFHAMQERDNALIAERVLEGSKAKVFVYQFTVAGQQVHGISVDGAHHLANFYGGIQHRIVASMEKRGRVFTFTSYPAPQMPMAVTVSVVPELEEENDFYRSVVEVKDIKTGNSFQAEKAEERFEERRNGGWFERPNFATIAQSKARRNAMLMVIPRDVQERFEAECIKLGRSIDITEDVFAEKRKAVMQYAVSKGLNLQRGKLDKLTNDQIAGLRDAMQDGGLPVFKKALAGLGLITNGEKVDEDGVVSEGTKAVEDKREPPLDTSKTKEKETVPVDDNQDPGAEDDGREGGQYDEGEPSPPRGKPTPRDLFKGGRR